MKRPLFWGATIAAVGGAAALGAATEKRWADLQLKKHPCSVRAWQPGRGYTYVSQDARDCLSLGPRQRFKGQWSDFAYGGGFRPEGGAPSALYDIDADGMTRAQLQWLADRRTAPRFFSGRQYQIEFIGRSARRDDNWTDALPDVIVMDRILSVVVLPPFGRK